MQLFATLRNAWRIKDIRRKLLFTLAMLLSTGWSFIPVPGIDPKIVAEILKAASKGRPLGLFDVFAGGALSEFSIFAMGIFPYINASIIMQLLQAVIPKGGQGRPEGRKN